MRLAALDRELFWDLLEDDDQGRRRAIALRLTYVLAEPNGWDGLRWELSELSPAVCRAALAGPAEPAA